MKQILATVFLLLLPGYSFAGSKLSSAEWVFIMAAFGLVALACMYTAVPVVLFFINKRRYTVFHKANLAISPLALITAGRLYFPLAILVPVISLLISMVHLLRYRVHKIM